MKKDPIHLITYSLYRVCWDQCKDFGLSAHHSMSPVNLPRPTSNTNPTNFHHDMHHQYLMLLSFTGPPTTHCKPAWIVSSFNFVRTRWAVLLLFFKDFFWENFSPLCPITKLVPFSWITFNAAMWPTALKLPNKDNRATYFGYENVKLRHFSRTR